MASPGKYPMMSLHREHAPQGAGRTVLQKVRGGLRTVGGLLNGTYPSFVTGNDTDGELPVFFFHRIRADVFQSQLNYLRTNGYKTQVTSDLFHTDKLDAKSVVLTFDDGFSDLYTVVYPLLKRFDFRAIAFISPFWVGSEHILKWDQAVEMHTTGHVDFQSHSYSHEMIPVSPDVVDFFRPVHKRMHRWDLPLSGQDDPSSWPDCGTPIYEYNSGLSDQKRFVPDAETEADCIEYVKARGGIDFFNRPDWRKQLMHVVDGRVSSPRYETDLQQKSRIRFQLDKAKNEIESRLLHKTVTAFAYPHHVQGKMTGFLLQETNHRMVFGGLTANPDSSIPGEKLSCFRRINGDFIKRLPGDGRISLPGVLLSKTR